MKNLPWKGRGQGHVSNFYIVDLENFATASRRYTGDIHNTPVQVGLFVTPIGQWKRLDLLHIDPLWPSSFITLISSGLVVQVVSALLRGNWQDFNWHEASSGPSAIAELLVTNVQCMRQSVSSNSVRDPLERGNWQDWPHQLTAAADAEVKSGRSWLSAADICVVGSLLIPTTTAAMRTWFRQTTKLVSWLDHLHVSKARVSTLLNKHDITNHIKAKMGTWFVFFLD